MSGILIVGGIEPYKEKSGEQYMSDSQVEHFRRILQTWRQELMEEVDRTVHNMQKEAANFPDPNDRATQESEFTMELRARDRERKLIKKIDESLAALESGDYGYCESCGVEMGIRRLEARPTETLCIDCKTLDEIRERRIGDGRGGHAPWDFEFSISGDSGERQWAQIAQWFLPESCNSPELSSPALLYYIACRQAGA